MLHHIQGYAAPQNLSQPPWRFELHHFDGRVVAQFGNQTVGQFESTGSLTDSRIGLSNSNSSATYPPVVPSENVTIRPSSPSFSTFSICISLPIAKEHTPLPNCQLSRIAHSNGAVAQRGQPIEVAALNSVIKSGHRVTGSPGRLLSIEGLGLGNGRDGHSHTGNSNR